MDSPAYNAVVVECNRLISKHVCEGWLEFWITMFFNWKKDYFIVGFNFNFVCIISKNILNNFHKILHPWSKFSLATEMKTIVGMVNVRSDVSFIDLSGKPTKSSSQMHFIGAIVARKMMLFLCVCLWWWCDKKKQTIQNKQGFQHVMPCAGHTTCGESKMRVKTVTRLKFMCVLSSFFKWISKRTHRFMFSLRSLSVIMLPIPPVFRSHKPRIAFDSWMQMHSIVERDDDPETWSHFSFEMHPNSIFKQKSAFIYWSHVGAACILLHCG